MKRMFPTLDGLAAVLLVYVGLCMIPPNWFWYEAGDVFVSDGTPTQVPGIIYDRNILQDVTMKYTVTIRDVRDGRLVCESRSNPFEYSANSTLPENIDLIWWTGGGTDCWPQKLGTYIMQTCWTVTEPFFGMVPHKTVCRKSNPFSVMEDL